MGLFAKLVEKIKGLRLVAKITLMAAIPMLILSVFAILSVEGTGSSVAEKLAEQELVTQAAMERDLEKAFTAFVNDPLVTVSMPDARKLFDEMVQNTSDYLQEYLH